MENHEAHDQMNQEHTAPSVQTEEEGLYRNAGAGRKESPFADSPYVSAYTSSKKEEPARQEPLVTPVRPPVRRGRKLAAVIAAAAVLIGSCGITGWAVNRRWEKETDLLRQEFSDRLSTMESQLRNQIATQSNGGISISGTGTAEGLTVTQVYAANVNSVVAVSNYQFVENRMGGGSNQLAGTGSGFIISADGYVITNHHVVEDADTLAVVTHLGEEYAAQLVGSDEINDVALLKLEAENLDPVDIGSSDDLLVGDMVVAIGNPLGELTATATVGYVSGKDRSVSTDGTIINMLQTDAAINSGNSGGPLFNMKGQVIGITTAKYSGSTNSGASIEGIGFAIPINDVMGMIDDFKNYGYLRNQAYLGVTVMNMDANTAQMYSLPTGSYVQTVVEGGCAEKAGIRPQDIIIAVGEYEVTGNTSLTATLRRFSAGDTTTITVFRAGAEIVLDITFDERPQNVDAESTEPTEPNEMPETGSYQEWFEYFKRYFGIG